MISSLSRTIVVFIFLIAKLCVFAEAAEEASLEIPLSGILGGDIDGEASSDNFGSAVAMSKNGSRVVVGARYHNSAEQVTDYYGNTYFQNSVGSVRVFEYGTTANSDVCFSRSNSLSTFFREIVIDVRCAVIRIPTSGISPTGAIFARF
jgi:hypothetical protein